MMTTNSKPMNNNEWQPIETAPKKSGTRVLLYFPAKENILPVEIMISNTMGENDVIWKLNDGGTLTATHWMPLPKPPTQN